MSTGLAPWWWAVPCAIGGCGLAAAAKGKGGVGGVASPLPWRRFRCGGAEVAGAAGRCRWYRGGGGGPGRAAGLDPALRGCGGPPVAYRGGGAGPVPWGGGWRRLQCPLWGCRERWRGSSDPYRGVGRAGGAPLTPTGVSGGLRVSPDFCMGFKRAGGGC